jgi:hypothetical protein
MSGFQMAKLVQLGEQHQNFYHDQLKAKDKFRKNDGLDKGLEKIHVLEDN